MKEEVDFTVLEYVQRAGGIEVVESAFERVKQVVKSEERLLKFLDKLRESKPEVFKALCSAAILGLGLAITVYNGYQTPSNSDQFFGMN